MKRIKLPKLGKKAQMEIIGLVVIVILIALGMLFMAKFALKEDPQKKIFTRKGLAYSSLSAVLKTTITDTECSTDFAQLVHPQMGKDLLEDCAKYYAYSPDGYSLYRCKSLIDQEKKHSCIFVNETITQLLTDSLGAWNKNYEFKAWLVKVSEEKPLLLVGPIKSGKGCTKKDRDSSGIFPIHTDVGLIETELVLCD